MFNRGGKRIEEEEEEEAGGELLASLISFSPSSWEGLSSSTSTVSTCTVGKTVDLDGWMNSFLDMFCEEDSDDDASLGTTLSITTAKGESESARDTSSEASSEVLFLSPRIVVLDCRLCRLRLNEEIGFETVWFCRVLASFMLRCTSSDDDSVAENDRMSGEQVYDPALLDTCK